MARPPVSPPRTRVVSRALGAAAGLLAGRASPAAAQVAETGARAPALSDSLGVVMLVAAVGVFVVVEGMLLAAAWRPRSPMSRESTPARGRPEQFRLSRGWELLWTTLPALALLVLGLVAARAAFG